MILGQVKSVCHISFGALVLSLNSSAALTTIRAGLVISPRAFKSRLTLDSETN
jgi:hypothetical protein